MSKTRDFDAMQKRRMRAANLLQRGFTQAQVAAELGVSRQSVSRWPRRLKPKSPWRCGKRAVLDVDQGSMRRSDES